jgi:DNA-binding MarR family transcriptional regulator
VGRTGSTVDPIGRSNLIARLLELQPQVRRRFEAAMPIHVRKLKASLHDVMANTTLRQLEVLRLLATHGPLPMHELARLHGINRSSTTEVVDRLVGHGLAERRHDPLDRRSVAVALTAQAEALLAQFKCMHEASVAALTDAYDDEELATLVRLLEKLAIVEPPAQVADEPARAATASHSHATGAGSTTRPLGR